MRERITVGVAQIDTRFREIASNLEKHLAYVAQARRSAVDLLVFPETSLSGYPHGMAHECSMRREDPRIGQLAAAAGEMTVVLGLIEEAPAAQFYNSGLVLSGGQQIHLHRKLNLPTYGKFEEGKHFAVGRYVESFEVVRGIWRASVLLCADLWNPALVHLAALHGVTLLIAPVNSADDAQNTGFSNPKGWDLVSRFYAMIYGMPVIIANRVGTEAGLSFWGGSRIVDPFGDVVVEATMTDEMLISAEIDYRDVRTARIQLPTVRDSNLALVHREISRLQQIIGVPESVRS